MFAVGETTSLIMIYVRKKERKKVKAGVSPVPGILLSRPETRNLLLGFLVG